MGTREAAFACKLIGPGYAIPEHFGTFPVLVQSPDEFIEEAKRYAPDTKIMVMEPGEELKVN